MLIELYDEDSLLQQEQEQLIHNLLTYAAERLDIEDDAEVSVTIVDDETIRQINRDYRGKDQATDVISFAIEDDVEDELEINYADFGLPRQLGDLFISIDRMRSQAEDYGHSYERELGFLCVHGFLHLNGYDHMNEEDEKEMFTLQESILEGYGLERK